MLYNSQDTRKKVDGNDQFGTTAFEDAGILPVVSYRKITMEVDFVNILLGNDTI